MSEIVLVTGGRHYPEMETVFFFLDAMHAKEPITRIVHGWCYDDDDPGATGADYWANCWAVSRGVSVEKFKANWTKYRKAAGPIRNRQMLIEAKPTVVLAFPGGTGTADMARQAERAGVAVIHCTH